MCAIVFAILCLAKNASHSDAEPGDACCVWKENKGTNSAARLCGRLHQLIKSMVLSGLMETSCNPVWNPVTSRRSVAVQVSMAANFFSFFFL